MGKNKNKEHLSNTYDSHHVLHYRQEWELRPPAKKIRNNPWLVPTIARDVHEELHREAPIVPLLGYHALMRTANDFQPREGDYLGSIDELLFSIDRSIQHPKTKMVEAELAQLTMRALELQKPFIRKGLIAP